LFSYGKRSKSIEISNTALADLNKLSKNSKKVWDTDGYTQKENDYESVTVDNMDIDLIYIVLKLLYQSRIMDVMKQKKLMSLKKI